MDKGVSVNIENKVIYFVAKYKRKFVNLKKTLDLAGDVIAAELHASYDYFI